MLMNVAWTPTFATLASAETKMEVMSASAGQDTLELTAIMSLMSAFPILAKTEAPAIIWLTFTPVRAFQDLMVSFDELL